MLTGLVLGNVEGCGARAVELREDTSIVFQGVLPMDATRRETLFLLHDDFDMLRMVLTPMQLQRALCPKRHTLERVRERNSLYKLLHSSYASGASVM